MSIVENDFTGGIFSEIQNMSSLREISLSDNLQLSGSIPTAIGLVTSLEDVNFRKFFVAVLLIAF